MKQTATIRTLTFAHSVSFTVLVLCGIGRAAVAYPGYIGFGYSSCSTCHFNPLGNGPLTDYGRALSAVEISGRLFQEDVGDEEIGRQSGWLAGFATSPAWLRMSGDYRGLLLARDLQRNAVQRWIHMQAEGSSVVKFWDDRILISGTLGYAPVPETIPQNLRDSVPTLISREHYVGVRVVPAFGVYVGLMEHAFGLRIPDHTAFIRDRTLTGMKDQTHGILFHGILGDWEGGIHVVLGNLLQDSSVRQKGATTVMEVELLEGVRLGASALMTSSEYRARRMLAIHSRVGLTKGNSLLLELGAAQEIPRNAPAKMGSFALLQGTARLARGVYALMTLEQFAEDVNTTGPRLYRAGPSLQYFPMQRVELRMDLLATRTVGLATVDPDIVALTTQVHLSL